jgi:hypothetical protein
LLYIITCIATLIWISSGLSGLKFNNWLSLYVKVI